MLEFDTLVWVPIDRRLILPDMLSDDDRRWINRYHASCYQRVAATLSPTAQRWMQAACADI